MSPDFKSTLIPFNPSFPEGSKYIGHESPPKFNVVDISHENLSL